MELDVQQSQPVIAREPVASAPLAGSVPALDATLQQQLKDLENHLRMVDENTIARFTRIFDFNDKLINQFKEIAELQKKQQEHLDAVTGWIQKHVEEQEAKKKTPAKK